MRILHAINTAEVGGGGEHLVQLARGLAQRGCSNTVVVGRDGPAAARLRTFGVPVVALGPMGAGTLWTLARVLHTQRPDIVHLHGSRAGFLGVLSARAVGLHPTVYTAHAPAFRRQDYQFLRGAFVLAERTSWALADRVICLTHGDLNAAKTAGIRTAHASVIPNGVDVNRFAVNGDRCALAIPKGVPVIGMVARLVRQKDPMTFLHAARLVADVFPDAVFLLIGDGPLRPMIDSSIRALGLEGRCMVLGTRNDIPQLLGAIDVVLLTSRWEGLPISVLEAMAAGKPLVASSLPGLEDVIEDGKTGIFVPPGDPSQFARAAVGLLRDPALRSAMGAQARRKVVKEFSIHQMVDATAAVYRLARSARAEPDRLALRGEGPPRNVRRPNGPQDGDDL